MSDEDGWPEEERRRAERHEVSYPVQLEVEVYGGDEGDDVEPATPFFARGETINVSRVGCLAEVDDRLEPGSSCTVKFVEPSERVKPQFVSGRVVRCESRSGDSFGVAVEFDEELLSLEPD